MSKNIESTTDLIDVGSRKESIEYHATDEVPSHQRDMGFWDMMFLWIGANSNNASWYLGGSIAGVGFGFAILLALVANPIAYAVLALVGVMGYRIGVSTMALTRPAFGIRGSLLPTIINTIVFLGWAVVNTFIAVISMSYIFQDVFNWPAYGELGGTWSMLLGIVIMTLLNLAAVSIGRQSVKIVERIGIILILILGIWVTVIVLKTHSLSEIIAWHPSKETSLPFGQAVDLMALLAFLGF